MSTLRFFFVAALTAACAAEEPRDQADHSASPDEPSPPENITPWEYDGALDEPQFDRARVEESIQAALGEILTLTGTAPLDAYVALMDTADDYCPYYSEYEGSLFWYGGCETSEGVIYQGYSFYEHYEDAPLFGEDSAMSGPVLNTQSTITLADGTRFDMGGSTHVLEGPLSDEMYAWSTAVTGSFGWANGADDDTWMSGTVKPTIETAAYLWDYGEHGQFRGVVTTAGLTGLDAEWDTVYLSELTSMDDLGGYWPCPEEAAGRISVRSTDGHWFDVVYDVEQEEPDGPWRSPPGTCDGCGQVYASGELVGAACNDFSVLRDWEDQPW